MKRAWSIAVMLAVLTSLSCSKRPDGTDMRTVDLVPVWQINDNDYPMIGRIADAFLDRQGNICLLDEQQSQLLVFSPDGVMQRTVGRPGEGPGEFRGGDCAFATANGYAVIQSLPVRLTSFDAEGLPRPAVTPKIDDGKTTTLVGVCSDGESWYDGFLLACIYFDAERRTHEELIWFSDSGVRLETLCGTTTDTNFRLINEGEGRRYHHRFAANDSRLFVATRFDEYVIQILSTNLKNLGVIAHVYQPLERTADEKRAIEEQLRAANPYPGMEFHVQDHHPAIEQVDIGPKGQLWVLTGHGARGNDFGILGVFDVYGAQGEFLTQVKLRSPGSDSFATDEVWILDDRVLVVKNEGASSLETDGYVTRLICYRMEGGI